MECPCELIFYVRKAPAVCASFREWICSYVIPRTPDACFTHVDFSNKSVSDLINVGTVGDDDCCATRLVTERMQGQLVLALCTSLILVSGALEHRLHARETDEASGGGKKTLTHSQSLAMYLYTISVMQLLYLHTNRSARETLANTSNNKAQV